MIYAFGIWYVMVAIGVYAQLQTYSNAVWQLDILLAMVWPFCWGITIPKQK